jgi:hypothetical protein
MNLKVLIGAIGTVVCFFFGIIFALASVYAPIRLVVAAILFIAGFGIIAVTYILFRKTPEIVHRVELSGEMKAVPIKCPSCGAAIPPSRIKIVDGVPYATCEYCGNTVEVAEEPKW